MRRSPAVSTVESQAQSTQHYVAFMCEVALILALATGLAFGFGAVVERLTARTPAAAAAVVVATDPQQDSRLPPRGDFVYDGATALGRQGEIGPTTANNLGQRQFQSSDVPDGAAPNELRLFGR